MYNFFICISFAFYHLNSTFSTCIVEMKRWNRKECLTRKIIIPIFKFLKNDKKEEIKNLFEGIINFDKKYFYCFSIYLSVQVCLLLLVPDFFDVLCSVFRHCQCFHKAFFSFCHEICILNNCLKVVFECVFFLFVTKYVYLISV